MTGAEVLEAVLREVFAQAQVEVPELRFPIIVKKGINEAGKTVRYYLNYSAEEQNVAYTYREGTELFSKGNVKGGDVLTIAPWDLRIVEAEK